MYEKCPHGLIISPLDAGCNDCVEENLTSKGGLKMPRKEGLRHLHIEIPEALDDRLKKIFKQKGTKSIVLREVLVNFCNKVEASNGETTGD